MELKILFYQVTSRSLFILILHPQQTEYEKKNQYNLSGYHGWVLDQQMTILLAISRVPPDKEKPAEEQ
jgi:alpha-mannosidase